MKKIMFNERYGLQQSVLDRIKNMTRRVIKGDFEDINAYHANGGWHFIADTKDGDFVEVKPAYEVGEDVAVAQCYEDAILDVGEEEWNKQHKWYCIENLRKRAGLHNKMFVSADLMPHYIHITKLKLERLQDISDEECLREGVEKWMDGYIVTGILERGQKRNVCFDTPREAFAALIDRISGKGTWDSNPWVFAYTFELLR